MNTLRKRQIRHPGVIISELRSNSNLWHKCRFWTAYFEHSALISAVSRSPNGRYERTNERTNEHTHMILFGLPTQYALRAIMIYCREDSFRFCSFSLRRFRVLTRTRIYNSYSYRDCQAKTDILFSVIGNSAKHVKEHRYRSETVINRKIRHFYIEALPQLLFQLSENIFL